MKKWRCKVCNYPHTGDEPPKPCPVCNVTEDSFEELDADGVPIAQPAGEDVSAPATETDSDESPSDAGPMKWRCTVCGYIHEGPEPPDECPICHADKSLFKPVIEGASHAEAEDDADTADKTDNADDASSKTSGAFGAFIVKQILKHHLHPISVHIPNGVLPVSFLFASFAVFFGAETFATAAYYNMIVILASLPFVIFSGYTEWKRNYSGVMTSRFMTKIICAGIVALLSFVIVMWLNIDPGVASPEAPGRRLFLFLHFVLLGAAAVAGYIGGKLVFRD